MARSGQWVSHQWQAVHFSGWTTTGWLSGSKLSTPVGQNSTHKPQPLHHMPKITTRPRGPFWAGDAFATAVMPGPSDTNALDISLPHALWPHFGVGQHNFSLISLYWNENQRTRDEIPIKGITSVPSIEKGEIRMLQAHQRLQHPDFAIYSGIIQSQTGSGCKRSTYSSSGPGRQGFPRR